MKKLLVVVDMINGFLYKGALADKSIERIVPNIIKKIKQAKENGDTIVFFRDSHSMSDEEFKTFPPHCLKGTYESQLIDQLIPYSYGCIDIEKNTTNGFITPEFQKLIKENKFDEVEATGCCTDICVLNFTNSFLDYKKKNKLDTKIKIAENCVDTFHGDEHDPDFINKVTLADLESRGVEIDRPFLANGMKLKSCKKITDKKYMNLFELEYQAKDGGKVYWTCASRKKLPDAILPTLNADAVSVLPYSLVDGKVTVYLTREFRYPANDYIWSIPSGLVEKGENIKDAGIRETAEEIGAKIEKIEHITPANYSSAGLSDEKVATIIAKVDSNLTKQNLDGSEKIDVVPVSLMQLKKILKDPNSKWENRAYVQLENFVKNIDSKRIIDNQRKTIEEQEKIIKDLQNKLNNREQGNEDTIEK